MHRVLGWLVVALGSGVLPPPASSGRPPHSRAVAITFDDLPVVSAVPQEQKQMDSVTTWLLAAIVRHRVPAIGFVNENKLWTAEGLDPARVQLLRRWLDAGLELGNHTFSHISLHQTPLSEFEQDVLQGEKVTRSLLARTGRVPRYFRHPFLHTGRDLATRRAFEDFLKRHGYRVAPVTIDNYDYVFSAAYDRAVARRDAAAAGKVATAYQDYMQRVVSYYESQSRGLFGRELRQILLLHANRLNATTLEDLLGMLRARGYVFVSLDSALADPAYQSRDEYVGPAGITWLHRWAITQNKPRAFFGDEPEVPKEIQVAAQ